MVDDTALDQIKAALISFPPRQIAAFEQLRREHREMKAKELARAERRERRHQAERDRLASERENLAWLLSLEAKPDA